MSHQMKDLFTEKIPITITAGLAKNIVRLVRAYETTKTNPLALNSPYLGVQKIYFLPQDVDNFFNLFSTDTESMTELVQGNTDKRERVFNVRVQEVTGMMQKVYAGLREEVQTNVHITPTEMKKYIREISAIDTNFQVISDPFNEFIPYVLYRIAQCTLNKQVKYETSHAVLMYFQYHFFTSLVNHRFKYSANESVMEATIESLTNKFDIKVYGTWKKVMEARATAILEPNSIHYKTLQNYDDDSKITYFISDVQTRIRNQINIVSRAYFDAKANNDRMGSYSALGTDNETGDNILLDVQTSFDFTLSSVYADALTVSRFLDDQALRIVNGLFKGVNMTRLRSVMVNFSDMATAQSKMGKERDVKLVDGQTIFIGAQILLQQLIQQSYRYCRLKGLSVTSAPGQILRTVMDVYSSSRVSDPGILQVKLSVSYLMEALLHLTREATVASYRLAFIIYIIILTFKYIKE